MSFNFVFLSVCFSLSEGCRIVASLASGIFPVVDEFDQEPVADFLIGGIGAHPLVGGAESGPYDWQGCVTGCDLEAVVCLGGE